MRDGRCMAGGQVAGGDAVRNVPRNPSGRMAWVGADVSDAPLFRPAHAGFLFRLNLRQNRKSRLLDPYFGIATAMDKQPITTHQGFCKVTVQVAPVSQPFLADFPERYVVSGRNA